MDAAVILARFVQYLSVSVVAGSSLFFLYGWRPGGEVRWPVRTVRAGAILGALATLAWIMLKAAEFGDGPADALKPTAVWAVASDTDFGRGAMARLVLMLVALAASLGGERGGRWKILSLVGMAAAASFAWTGHGQADDGLAGVIHLCGDVLHLWSAVVWIGALVALAGLLVMPAPGGGPVAARTAASGLQSFSDIGVAVVAVIVATGLINSWFLVGLQAIPSILTTAYGQLLAAKLAIFVGMLGLAAANRYRHTPRIEASIDATPDALSISTAARSLVIETAAAAMALLLVAWLGNLPPPAHG